MFRPYLDRNAALIDAHLEGVMAQLSPPELAAPMRHVIQGGKRMRGFLVLEGARIHGVDLRAALACASAIECIHAYSLVHDDLPCMDDDDLRRGRETIHVKWDEATAVLTGDALQTLAFEIILDPESIGDPSIRSTLALSLARASGTAGMAGGQALDILAEKSPGEMSLEQTIDLQRRKTGALIVWSAEAGPRLAGMDSGAMREFSECMGLAYQIADDLLDHSGDSEVMGKKAGKDQDAGKATLVSLLGESEARRKADELVHKAHAALAPYGKDAEMLKSAMSYTVNRKR